MEVKRIRWKGTYRVFVFGDDGKIVTHEKWSLKNTVEDVKKRFLGMRDYAVFVSATVENTKQGTEIKGTLKFEHFFYEGTPKELQEQFEDDFKEIIEEVDKNAKRFTYSVDVESYRVAGDVASGEVEDEWEYTLLIEGDEVFQRRGSFRHTTKRE